MERMWQERADYGHFFYRIPNGESAADAYDRISGFNESLWRQFGYDDFPSVCVLVTHGLMGRVFLMKWYKWTVEYFEDLRNIHHCEFLVMEQDQDGSYDLKTTLRTWSELETRKTGPPSPKLPPRRWGGCPDGCTHNHASFTERVKRSSTLDLKKTTALVATPESRIPEEEVEAAPSQEPTMPTPIRQKSTMKFTAKNLLHEYEISTSRKPNDGDVLPAPQGSSSEDDDIEEMLAMPTPRRRKQSLALRVGRDGGGSYSGMPSPEVLSEAEAEERRKTQPENDGNVEFRTESLRSPLTIVQETSESGSGGDFREGTPAGDIY